MISTLIDKKDTNELVRDKIALILATEEASQRALAVLGSKDENEWKFSVFIERSNPWEVLTDDDGSEIGEMPLVNVLFDSDSFDNKGSSIIGMQKARGTFYIDCYAHKNKTSSMAGDEATSKEADRIARLVRNILMFSEYAYLDMRGIVTKREIIKREKLQPDIKDEALENIVCSRITLSVEYEEYTNQSLPVDLEVIYGDLVSINSEGQVIVDLRYDS